MSNPQVTTEELERLIDDEVEKIGPWPADLTMKIYPIGATWNASIKAAKPSDAAYRDKVAVIVGKLRRQYDLRDRPKEITHGASTTPATTIDRSDFGGH